MAPLIVYDETSTPGRYVGHGLGIGRVGSSIGRSHASAQLHQIEDIARQQRDPIYGFGGNELADGGVAGLQQVDGLRYGDRVTDAAHAQSDVDSGDLIHSHLHIVLSDGFEALHAGRHFIDAGIERHKCVQASRRCNGMLFDSGCVVEQGDPGFGDNGACRVGDQTADASSAGLGEGGGGSTKNQNPCKEKTRQRKSDYIAVFHGYLQVIH